MWITPLLLYLLDSCPARRLRRPEIFMLVGHSVGRMPPECPTSIKKKYDAEGGGQEREDLQQHRVSKIIMHIFSFTGT